MTATFGLPPVVQTPRQTTPDIITPPPTPSPPPRVTRDPRRRKPIAEFGTAPVHDSPRQTNPGQVTPIVVTTRDIAEKPGKFYRPEIITSSKKISDIVTSVNRNAILIAPAPKSVYTKVNQAQPLASILGQMTKTHTREQVKPKGSRNVPVTTKRTVYIRTNSPISP